MQEKKDLSLYLLIERFAQQFTYKYEDGVTFDIKGCLEGMKENQTIKDFMVAFDQETRHYQITIIYAEEVRLLNVHPIFLQFQRFVALGWGGTMYAHKEIQNGVRYVLLLLQPVWKKKASYYCEVDFVRP